MVTKHTMEDHLAQDKNFYQSLSADTQFANFVQLWIIEMSHLLAQLQGSSVEPYTTPNAGGSPSASLEGAFKSHDFLHILTIITITIIQP